MSEKEDINKSDCCASANCCQKKDDNKKSYKYMDLSYCTEEFLSTPVGKIAEISTSLDVKDKFGAFKVRWGIKRNDYRIEPNIYAIGNPNDKSPVLVTANYKLTFDALRKELDGIDAWIMVIDTKGINVWCAAGKGTFGTQEIISKINSLKLSKVVSHKKIILPQLGAPGVKAHVITKETGFKIIYGPVRTGDIKAFLDSNLKASKEMRTVNFTFNDRLITTPVEMNISFKFIPLFFVFFIIYNFIAKESVEFWDVILMSLLNTIPFAGAIIAGSFFVPILLPYIPFRAFSLKGLVLGIIWSVVTLILYDAFMFPQSILFMIATVLLILVITTYLSLNFTGATTYTSFSGAELETRITFPIAITASIIGLLLIILVKVLEFV